MMTHITSAAVHCCRVQAAVQLCMYVSARVCCVSAAAANKCAQTGMLDCPSRMTSGLLCFYAALWMQLMCWQFC